MKKKFTAHQTLEHVIDLLLGYLEEMSAPDCVSNDFIEGERTAYIECLEAVQNWKHAEKKGLNFNIESRYPL